MRMVLAVLVGSAVLAAGVAYADVTPVGVERKVLVAPPVGEPPLIDGDLSDAVWSLAEPSGGFVVEESGRKASQPTEVRVLSDANHLYLGVVCTEPLPQRMRATVTKDNQDIWGNDCIEFNVEPTGAHKDIYQMRFNSVGAKELVYRENKRLDASPIRVRTEVGQREWRIEAAIPFAVLGIQRAPEVQMRWRINFERLRTVEGDENDDWQWTAGDWANPENYGILVVPGAQVEITKVGKLGQTIAGPGNETSIALRNLSGEARDYGCAIWDVTDPQQGQLLAERTVRVPAGGDARADLSSFTIKGGEMRRALAWRVTEAASGRVIFSYQRDVLLTDVLRVRMQRPRYRGYVFPETKNIEAKVSLRGTQEALRGMTLRARIVQEANGIEAARQELPAKAEQIVVLPASAVPPKPCRLLIEVVEKGTGEVLSQESLPLIRLSAQEQDRLRYYVDDYGRLVHEGRPILPMGFYSSGEQQIREIADSPFDVVLNYGMYRWSDETLRSYFDTAQECGIRVIFDVNGIYPGWGGTPEEWQAAFEKARTLIVKWKNEPALMAWYLNDERPKEMVPDLRRLYEVFRENDPDHPCFIVHFITEIFDFYAHTCDIFSSDPYPIPSRPVTYAATLTQAAAEAMDGQGAVWTVPQNFAWYQMWEPEDPSLGTGRDRIPTENELRRGRAPTYEETRCMTWLSIVHGARGLVYWAYYNMKQLPQYEEMWAWMKDIGRELRSVEAVILAPKDLPTPKFSPNPQAIHCMAKEYQGKAHLFVVNGEKSPWTGWAALPAGMTCERAVDLLTGETIVGQGKRLPLRVKGMGVRVLRLD